jgi:hypothetical protein
LTVGVPIGLYLYFLYTQGNQIITQQVPSFQGLSLPVWFAFVASLTISSVVAVGIMGYILLSTIGRSAIVEPLKSRGLRIYQREG